MASTARRFTIRTALLPLCTIALVHCNGDDSSEGPPGSDAGHDVSVEAAPAEGSAPEGSAPEASAPETSVPEGSASEGGNNEASTVDRGVSQEGGDAGSGDAGAGINKIQHVLVIYMENWSFDSLYGEFAGAENLSSAGATNAPRQLDPSGVIYTTLPQNEPALGGGDAGALGPDGAALSFANAPFALEPYVTTGSKTIDLVHRFYQEQMQINGGAMNNFVSVSDAKGMVMGYFHTSGLPLAGIAAQYTLCDHFFHAAFGGSFLNHQWLIAAASPTFPNAPSNVVAQPADDAGTALLARDPSNGNPIGDGFVTPDGYAVNTSYSVNTPHPATANPAQLVPNQTNPTIGDRLSDKTVD